jgi:ATP-dependent DNA helicase UvrD/PcrA
VCERLGECGIFKKSIEQLDYVLSTIQSNIFLRACPGGGKTEVVGLKAAYEFHAWTKRNCGIAILTFTNSAADVIRKRVQQYAGVQNSGHPHFIGTVDSWLHRYLAHPFGHLTTGYLGRRFQTGTDRSIRLVDDDEREGWINNYRCKTPYYYIDKKTGKARSLPLYANSLRYDCESGMWQVSIPEGNSFTSAQKYFASAGVSSFRDGFATHHGVEWICHRLLKTNAILRERLAHRFPFIIVDECQDLSWLQLEILGLLGNDGSRLHFVGDLNQAIYEFKEVEPRKIEAFVTSRSFEIWKLTENFRSCQPIVDLCSNLVPSERVIGSGPISNKPACVCFAYSGQDGLATLPDRFKELIGQRGIDPMKSVVLARGWSAVRRLQGLSHERPSNNAMKLATAIHLWCSQDIRLWEETLRYFGDFVSSKYFNERSNSRQYYCPESVDSPVRWRLFLAHVLDACVKGDSGLSNLEQSMPSWAECVRKSFGEIVRSCIPTLEVSLQGEAPTIDDLDGNAFKAPKNTKNKRVLDNIVTARRHSDKIRSTTIHSVKGETFEAILLVSSLNQKGGIGGHWQEWLQDSRAEPARFAYVASSRPRRLLAWAIPLSKEPQEDLQRITALGFTPVDPSEWKKPKRRKARPASEAQRRLFELFGEQQ